MKIIADNQKRLYELTYLLSAELTEAEQKGIATQITDLISKHKGEAVQTESWGKRDLAYKIKHGGKFHRQGVYTFVTVQFLPASVQKFEAELKLNEDLLRHLLVLSENQNPKAVAETNNVSGKEKAE